MATVILVRHGRTSANANGILAGRSPGIGLDDVGVRQAHDVASTLSPLPLAAIYASPLQRCQETASVITTQQTSAIDVLTDDGLMECDYGEWTGGKLSELSQRPEWKTVQTHPAGMQFPQGESLRGMFHRAADSVRRLDAHVTATHGPTALWVAVSHGDIIKSVVADALGMHLDSFQRLLINPGSICVVRYTPSHSGLLRFNARGGNLDDLVPTAPTTDGKHEPETEGATMGGEG